MSRIYEISMKLHEKTGIKETSLFLFLNSIFWAVIAGVVGCIGCYTYAHTLVNQGVTLVCIVGYSTMIMGFFGGILYLYRQD